MSDTTSHEVAQSQGPSDARAEACYDPLIGGGEGHRWACRFPGRLLENLWGLAPKKYFQSFTARDVLENANYVYYGVRIKDGNDAPAPWGYCFVGTPASVRIGPMMSAGGGLVPLPKGYVFTVYVSQSGEVYEWRLEMADPRDSQKPLEHDYQRFPGGVVWQRN